jgi:hypothetical protein
MTEPTKSWDELAYVLTHCDECDCEHGAPKSECACVCHDHEVEATVTPKFDQRVYYLEFVNGNCGLRVARSITQAKADARHYEAYRLAHARRATEADVAYVRDAGGWVPEGKVDR